ncbi:MAG: hypothetical protein JO061_21860, partial [Acidobacteriaceae bacterium]|nr:hypothetical protein [Acidobacteriaceae bacterium]
YKSAAVPLEWSGTATSLPNLNLRVPATALSEWLITNREQFAALGSRSTASVAALLASGQIGLFYSNRPGLVVWIVSRTGDLARRKAEIRRFALDTDLIVGAIPARNYVAIIARERQTPLSVLPPLRTETVLLLAAVKADQLEQSYERNNPASGKTSVGLDWAPIYLSDTLIDTEYGSLLNITDQLLKSWSSAGLVHYANFHYPEPGGYPFGKLALDQVLHTDALTYNWNSLGVGYTLNSNASHVFALNRTGALPVSYFPEHAPAEQLAKVSKYEETGYNYFSSRNDPNLTRVVQYAALYQIFRRFGITSTEGAGSVRKHPETEQLVSIVEQALQRIENASNIGSLVPQDLMNRETYVESLGRVQLNLRTYSSRTGDTTLEYVARALADPRTVVSGMHLRNLVLPFTEGGTTPEGVQMARSISASEAGAVLQQMIIDTDQALSRYARAAKRDPATWIKTPSYVLSTARTQSLMGGHNLYAAITDYETSAIVPRGEIEIARGPKGERIYRVNPSDTAKLPELLRKVATSGESDTVVERQARTWLAQAATEPVPERKIALGLVRGDSPFDILLADHGRGMRGSDIPGAPTQGGWSASDEPINAQYAILQQPDRKVNAIAVERKPDFKYSIVVPGLDSPRIAHSYTGAIDAVVEAMQGKAVQGETWSLHFAGFEPEEVSKFTRTTEIHLDGVDIIGLRRPNQTDFSTAYTSLHERYDFRSARVVHSGVETRFDADGVRRVLRTDIEIPSVRPERPPLLIRIFVRIFGPVTEAIKAKIDLVIASVVHRSLASPRGWSAEHIATSIKTDLRKMNVRVDLQVHTDAGDIYAAEDYELVRKTEATRPAA